MQALPDQKPFHSTTDVLRLEILDLRRLNGYWRNSGDAIERIYSILSRGSAVYGIFDVPDFDAAPERPNFPGWSHVGNHERIGRQLWNWFGQNFPNYDLSFSDAPDFRATTTTADGDLHFIRGDIGHVSPSTFVFTLLHMRPGDLWISICDGGKRHVIIMFLGPTTNESNIEKIPEFSDKHFKPPAPPE